MTPPTDAERATARELVTAWTWTTAAPPLGWQYRLEDAVAAALAEARAEGWRAGMEAAAQLAVDGFYARLAERIRALAGPGER